MTDIQKWILQLQSDDPNKRYEACEELPVVEQIPDEAISALYETTKDPNADVAEAAQRALGVHTVQETSTPQLVGFLTALGIGTLAFILIFVIQLRGWDSNHPEFAVNAILYACSSAIIIPAIIIGVIAGVVGFVLTGRYLGKKGAEEDSS